MRAFFRALKTVSVITLVFFSWTYLPLYQIAAYAATEKQVAANSGLEPIEKQKTKKSEEKIEKALTDIREKTTKVGDKAARGEDTSAEIDAIKSQKTEIEAIDSDLRKNFAATEQKLKAANLPKEILSRHYKFVKNYEDNLVQLRANIDTIEQAKTPSALTTAIAKTNKYLDKVKPPKKRKPFDPNKLPNRGHQIKHAALEEKKPEGKKINSISPLRKSSGLNPIIEQKTAQARRPILVASNGPLDGLLSTSQTEDLSSHEQLANLTTDSLIMNSVIAATQPASAADLAETPEIQFTPAIKAKAQELENKPLKIYEWVRNNIEFVPTYGSIQGADMCFQTKQCNDIDTASLLIALLRASNISARYVYGTIEIPIDKAKNWVGGATDPNMVGTILATNGIPAKTLISGGTVTAVQLEHVWVNAWINYIPSRGAVHRPGHEDTWIPLDASFKQYDYTQGIDISSAVPFDTNTFVNQIQSTAMINQSDGSVTNVNSTYVQQTMQDYQTQVQNYIQQNYPNATVGDVIGKKEIIQKNYPILVGTLPYKTIQVSSEFAQVPDNLRYKVTFEIRDSNATGTSLSYTIGISELDGKRVTLSYTPATANDAQVIDSYNGIFNVPAYLVNMKPQIKIDGVVAATGNPIGLGNDQTFNMQFVSPAYGTESVSNIVTAGAYYGIGINPNKVPQELLAQRKTNLESVKDTTCVNSSYADECSGELLYATAMGYFFVVNGFDDIFAQSNGIIKMKDVSEAIVSDGVSASNLFGIPTGITETGLMIDVDRNIYVAFPKDGNQSRVRQFMMSAGQMSSAMEHGIFESMYQEKGVSTVQVLKLANDQGIPIYTITQNNISSILPALQISDEVINDIQNAVNAGKTVIVPKQNITYYNWTGTGYVVMDSQTGAGAYMISTSLAGGGCCIAAGGLPVGCTIIDLEHKMTPLYFLAVIGTAIGTVSMLVWGLGALVSAGLFLAFAVLAPIVLLIAILAAFIIAAMVMALIGYYSNQANIFPSERRKNEIRNQFALCPNYIFDNGMAWRNIYKSSGSSIEKADKRGNRYRIYRQITV